MSSAGAAQRSAGGNARRKKAGQTRRQQLSRLEDTTVRRQPFLLRRRHSHRTCATAEGVAWRQLEHRERRKEDRRLAR